MDSIQKFYSDIEKIKKHSRPYDGNAVCGEIKNLFERQFRGFTSLAASIADYWFKEYASLEQPSEMPSDKSVEKLGAMYALLENDLTSIDSLDEHDFKELCALVNYEAEELPLDLLNDLMAVFVDHGSL